MKVEIRLRDPLAPGLGYQIRIDDDEHGILRFYSTVHPNTGKDLTYSDCLEIASRFDPTPKPT